MGIFDSIKNRFSKKETPIPVVAPVVEAPVRPTVPPDPPLSFATVPDGKIIKNFWPLSQRKASDKWDDEIGYQDEKIPWNSCMTFSFAMTFLSLIHRINLVFWKNDMEFVYLRDILTAENIGEWYYKELMEFIVKSPEKDHRWQAQAHCNFINKILKDNGRSDIQFVVQFGAQPDYIGKYANPVHLRKMIDLGFVYPAGTWETACGHIIAFCGYDKLGAYAGNPWGKWAGGINQYSSAEAKVYFYSWKDVDRILGLNTYGTVMPYEGRAPVWGAVALINGKI